jgi:hypothetical protein
VIGGCLELESSSRYDFELVSLSVREREAEDWVVVELEIVVFVF